MFVITLVCVYLSHTGYKQSMNSCTRTFIFYNLIQNSHFIFLEKIKEERLADKKEAILPKFKL